jgi:hypothetical protein
VKWRMGFAACSTHPTCHALPPDARGKGPQAGAWWEGDRSFSGAISCGKIGGAKDGQMAEPKSIFDEIDEKAEARAIAEAEADIAAGRVVPHAKVREWLLKLAKGEVTPPPWR